MCSPLRVCPLTKQQDADQPLNASVRHGEDFEHCSGTFTQRRHGSRSRGISTNCKYHKRTHHRSCCAKSVRSDRVSRHSLCRATCGPPPICSTKTIQRAGRYSLQCFELGRRLPVEQAAGQPVSKLLGAVGLPCVERVCGADRQPFKRGLPQSECLEQGTERHGEEACFRLVSRWT